MMKALFTSIILATIVFSPAPSLQKEYVVWMTLPSTGVLPDSSCRDTIPGPPINHLETLEAWAVSFNPSNQETLRAWIGIEGMEGDTIGVVWEFPDTVGVMGVMKYRVKNNVDWSCIQSFVFASPPERSP